MLMVLGLSLVIGIVLGLLGGGGSILTVPMLVYVMGVEPRQAVATSFVVVGIVSLLALLVNARRGYVCWNSGLLFGLAGMAGAFGGGRLAAQFSDQWLMGLFGLISFLTGLLMLRDRRVSMQQLAAIRSAVCPLELPLLRVLFDGVLVGLLTGMVGVGGGFLIVPALVMLVGLPMQGAIGTSFLVIVMNAVAGMGGYSQLVSLDWQFTGMVAAGALVGGSLGAWWSAYFRPSLLRKLFAGLVLLVAGYVLWQTLAAVDWHSLTAWLKNGKTQAKVLIGLMVMVLLIGMGYWIHRTERSTFSLR